MPIRWRIGIEPEDVKGHTPLRHEDLSGQEVTVRMEDGTEVEGHAYKFRGDMTGDDTEGHMPFRRIEVEVDDSEAHLLRAATDRGDPIHIRFPDGAEVVGQPYKR